MEIIVRICLFLSGLINFIPSILAFLPGKISRSYGIEILSANHELLLRHRAVLFGIVGGIMIFSALSKKYYSLSFVIGFVSMLSFIILYKIISGEINPELRKVFNIDIIGVIILTIGFILFKLK